MHLFEPCDFNFDYKVIVTNKTELKPQFYSTMDVALRKLSLVMQKGIAASCHSQHSEIGRGNQVFTLCSIMAHNLC